MSESQKNNPLHGITLQQIVEHLEQHLGWERMAVQVKINCFRSDPSVKSSLKFLRKTPWAREKVEALYLSTLASSQDSAKPNKPSTEAFVWPDLTQK
jgi:uncharacterized protein (DUF2132 family)